MLVYLLSPILRSLAKLASWSTYNKFNQGLANPEYAQRVLFRKLMKSYNGSKLALKCGPVKSYDDFTKNLRPIEYEELKDSFLSTVPSRIKFYEKTSGSSGASKLIPYTSDLLGSFSSLFKIWAFDLLAYGPLLNRGRFYFSISPQFDNDSGLEDDSDYLDSFFKWLLKPLMVGNSKLKKLKKPQNFKKALALSLLAEPNLEVISVWSPSYLTVITDYCRADLENLIAALRVGSINLEGQKFTFPVADEERIKTIRQMDWQEIFPKLKLISTWGNAHAKKGFQDLIEIFPQAFVQAKGLLATEAPLTVPLIKYGAQAPLINEVFFEFISKENKILLLHQLEQAQVYEVLITQKGGLYRYKLGDLVKVTGTIKNTPALEFVGKSGLVSDLVGEKLNEIFVQGKLAALGLKGVTALIPDLNGSKYYLLSSDISVTQVTTRFDAELMESFHYTNARKLGQLNCVEALYIEDLSNLLNEYHQKFKGMKLGDIKPQSIYHKEHNGELFQFLSKSL
ncbi:MAG: hypothetical protein HN509_13990 [Halobacteriovoraceae bacterium]|nr:hypothetical protein [Halobacteriovoraceae bacterium]MBT5093211.1 hypothetical protein [Halobacteriovoraceae bacterium]